jgi:hypothetical protein
MSSTQDIVAKIEVIIKEIKVLPPPPASQSSSRPAITTTEDASPSQHISSNDNEQGCSRQSTIISRIGRPVCATAPRWGNFFEDIKKNDEAAYKERQAKAAAFSASGEKNILIETYKETKTRV